MARIRIERYVPAEGLKALGLAIAGFGPLVVAGVLVPFRDDSLVSSNVALVFVIVVILAAAAGGRAAGIVAAVVSTFTYDFFFTHPYQSLKIENTDDIGTAVLLLVIGLLVAALTGFAQVSRRRSARAEANFSRAQAVGDLVAAGAPIDDVVGAVESELTELLALEECEYEREPSGAALPAIDRNGSLDGGRRRWVGTELSLPAEGAEIRVVGRGQDLGRVVMVGDWEVGVPVETRRVAVAIVDHLGEALAADARAQPAELDIRVEVSVGIDADLERPLPEATKAFR